MLKKVHDRHYLGMFKTVTPRLIVTDPCYTNNTWCQYVIENAVPGRWLAYVTRQDEGRWGVRNASIEIMLADYDFYSSHNRWTEEKNAHIGVDSGQAGFFEHIRYPAKGQDDDAFYDAVCELTLKTPEQAGVGPFYAVSSSGYGDGGYPLFVRRNAEDEVIAAKIVFIEAGL